LDWDAWKPWYMKIRRDLKLNFAKDESAAKLLDKLLKTKDTETALNAAKSCVSNRNVLIFGCGPSLEKNIQDLLDMQIPEGKLINIAANGAISALLKYKIYPHISVTDLDGNIDDLLKANREGTISFVHAHGDNISRLKKFVPKFNKIVGTTQTRPFGKVMNYGGFTDGDRAVFIAEFLKSKSIFLLGFDFGNIVGKFSKPNLKNHAPASDNKIKKLKISKNLIKWISTWSDATIYNLTGSNEKIKGIKDLQFDKLKSII